MSENSALIIPPHSHNGNSTGLLGLCGSNDLRSVIAMSKDGDTHAHLALEMFVYRIKKYIGSYLAAIGEPCHAVVFSAGVGENSPLVRSLVCQDMQARSLAGVTLGYAGKISCRSNLRTCRQDLLQE